MSEYEEYQRWLRSPEVQEQLAMFDFTPARKHTPIPEVRRKTPAFVIMFAALFGLMVLGGLISAIAGSQ
jgi:hypothetical protein